MQLSEKYTVREGERRELDTEECFLLLYPLLEEYKGVLTTKPHE